MDNQVKGYVIPVFAFILSFGLIAGCNNNKSNSSSEMESDTTAMTGRQAMNNNSMQTYSATLKGESETPAVTTDASGNVTVTLNGDELHVKGQFSGLSSEYTASHIHKGAKGEPGPVVQPLDPSINDDNMSGSFDESYTLSDSLVQALKNGMLYVNVHSQQHKKGEIRGQLTTSGSDTTGSMNNSGY